jgi:hypothetical protein
MILFLLAGLLPAQQHGLKAILWAHGRLLMAVGLVLGPEAGARRSVGIVFRTSGDRGDSRRLNLLDRYHQLRFQVQNLTPAELCPNDSARSGKRQKNLLCAACGFAGRANHFASE